MVDPSGPGVVEVARISRGSTRFRSSLGGPLADYTTPRAASPLPSGEGGPLASPPPYVGRIAVLPPGEDLIEQREAPILIPSSRPDHHGARQIRATGFHARHPP